MSTATDTARPFALKRFLAEQMRNIAPVFTLIVLVIFFATQAESFRSLDNLMNILSQASITGIIAVGLTFVILTAEIDLSVAAIANAIGITVAYFTIQPEYVNIANIPLNGALAIVLTLASCFALGCVNAFGVTAVGIPSFIMTLAMMQIANGISALLVRGQIAYIYPDLITTLGSGTIFGIKWSIVVCLLFMLVAHLVLTYTRFGRYVYMVGGNREAAEYSGVNVKLILAAVMIISAMCSGIAGMLGVAYFGSAQQNQFEFVPARCDRGGGGWRHQPVRRAWRNRQYDHRAAGARRAQQRARSRRDRQLPEDPDPRPHPAGGAGDQRLRPEAARERARVMRTSDGSTRKGRGKKRAIAGFATCGAVEA